MYRMVVAESADKRDGRFVEILGTYDPKNKIQGQQVRLELDRIAYWMGVGAQPTDTARSLINRAKRESAARGESGADVKEAKEVANRAAQGSKTLSAGGTGATGKAPTEAADSAR